MTIGRQVRQHRIMLRHVIQGVSGTHCTICTGEGSCERRPVIGVLLMKSLVPSLYKLAVAGQRRSKELSISAAYVRNTLYSNIPYLRDMTLFQWRIGYRRFERSYFLHLQASIRWSIDSERTKSSPTRLRKPKNSLCIYLVLLQKTVVVRSMAWGCGCLLPGIAGSNTAGGMEVCLLYVLCVTRWRSLCRADLSCRGVLSSDVCLSVIVKPWQRGGPGPLVAVAL